MSILLSVAFGYCFILRHKLKEIKSLHIEKMDEQLRDQTILINQYFIKLKKKQELVDDYKNKNSELLASRRRLVKCYDVKQKEKEDMKESYDKKCKLLSVRLGLIYKLNDIKNTKIVEKCNNRQEEMYNLYGPISGINNRIEILENQFMDKKRSLLLDYYHLKSKFKVLAANYKESKSIYDNLQRKIYEYEEDLEYMAYGVYRPHFTYEHTEDFKNEIIEVREKQKDLIKSSQAWTCDTSWTVNSSIVQGRVMTKRQAKLMLRAFNGECDAAMAKVTWNNALTLEKRIEKSFVAINKLGKSNDIEITAEFFNERLNEFRLYYELKLKLQEEKEEQRQIREAMREEAKLEKDIERATKKADEDRVVYEEAMRNARKELERAGLIDKKQAEDRVAEIQIALDDALARKARALSQAQLTKSGHVYIISNIGSFGANSYKIGMTRRLDPLDRIRELGGASVPFPFDIHGVIYSHNAPELESALHRYFADRKVNRVNGRKEFFNVDLSEIQEAVEKLGFDLNLTSLAEAQQYRETRSIIETIIEKEKYNAERKSDFPVEIFP